MPIEYILEHPHSKVFQLYQSAKSLDFIKAKPLKPESHIKPIVLISSISKFIKERNRSLRASLCLLIRCDQETVVSKQTSFYEADEEFLSHSRWIKF